MKTYDFKVLIEIEEKGGFVVSCPSLPGCYTQGDTIEEAFENIKEAIILCLKDMETEGIDFSNPTKALIGSVMVSI